MKNKSIFFLILFIIIISRNSILNLINNTFKIFLNKDNTLEINYLNNEITRLKEEYNKLLDFKNNISIDETCTITNVYKNNYGFDKLIINGDNYNLYDEVLTKEGLIGYISKINNKYSEISYIYNTKVPVRINDNYGKIISSDKDNNIIISEIDNANLNDSVYSVNNSYIGKVIKIDNMDLNTTITVKPIDLKNIDYVLVRSV